MSKVLMFMPRVAIFLAGVAAGALTTRRERGASIDSSEIAELKDSVAKLEERVAAQEASTIERFQHVDSRLDEQAAKLAEVPSTTQIIGAMEQILARSMASLDERLASQAHAIEVLRATVSQTDGLLERVLESLEAYSESGELASDAILNRPAV